MIYVEAPVDFIEYIHDELLKLTSFQLLAINLFYLSGFQIVLFVRNRLHLFFVIDVFPADEWYVKVKLYYGTLWQSADGTLLDVMRGRLKIKLGLH